MQEQFDVAVQIVCHKLRPGGLSAGCLGAGVSQCNGLHRNKMDGTGKQSRYRRYTQQAVKLLLCRLLSLLLAFSLSRASAGGGPETLLLVVNGDSPLSLRIANEYVQLRDIPHDHVLWLHGIPSTKSIPIKLFREQIWRPINDFIHNNGLEEEIDAIIYSADFPYAVNFSADLKQTKQEKNKYIGSMAALTSLTYFGARVASGGTEYLKKNHYYRDFAGPRIKSVEVSSSNQILTEKEMDTLRKEGRKALKKNEYDAAVGIYQRVAESAPRMAEHWHDLAAALAAAGKESDALEALTKAVDLGWSDSLQTGHDPLLQPLATNPQFEKLIGRMEGAYLPIMLTHGFRHQYVWSDAGLTAWDEDDFKDQYYLSTMLAYTGLRGNSYPEVISYLRSATASDGSQPEGSVYLMDNNDVRSVTRRKLFPTTLQELARRDRRAAVLSKRIRGQNGKVPVDKQDVIGVVVGSRSFDWSQSKSRLLPGAIAESLTSYGGDFNNGSQTKLTEFLRHGAAGSSGAVAEPYSFQEKFPVPMVHSYYADGCSLAEAFYQSVEFPYQLLIVGDPLARPFARFAEVGLQDPDPKLPWSGKILLQPSITTSPGHDIRAVELWIDGQRISSAAAGTPLELDTTKLENGVHRLRLVAIEESTIETRSYAGFDIKVLNHGGAAVVIDPPPSRVSYGDSFRVSGSAADGSNIALYQGNRMLGGAKVVEGRWDISVSTTKLGVGPVQLLIKETLVDTRVVRVAYLPLHIEPPEPIPAVSYKQPLHKGLKAVITDQRGELPQTVIETLQGAIRDPSKEKIKNGKVLLSGFFQVTKSGFYQFVISTGGYIKLSVDNRLLVNEVEAKGGELYPALSLAAGWHSIKIELVDSDRLYLTLLLAGDKPAELLGGENLGH